MHDNVLWVYEYKTKNNIIKDDEPGGFLGLRSRQFDHVVNKEAGWATDWLKKENKTRKEEIERTKG